MEHAHVIIMRYHMANVPPHHMRMRMRMYMMHAHAHAHVHGACAWACGMDMRMYVPCTLARHMRQEQVSKALLNLLQRRRPDCASHQRRSRSSCL